MKTDFEVTTWGRYFIVNACTDRAEAWMRDHWRTPNEPPTSRATKVARLVSEIVWWWDNYAPTYTYTLTPGAHEWLSDSERIL